MSGSGRKSGLGRQCGHGGARGSPVSPCCRLPTVSSVSRCRMLHPCSKTVITEMSGDCVFVSYFLDHSKAYGFLMVALLRAGERGRTGWVGAAAAKAGRGPAVGPDAGPAPFPAREARDGHVRGLRESDPRPVYPSGVARPRVARRLPQVRGVQPVPGRDVHVLRERRENLLQAGLRQVRRLDPGFGPLGLEGHGCASWARVPALTPATPGPAGCSASSVLSARWASAAVTW